MFTLAFHARGEGSSHCTRAVGVRRPLSRYARLSIVKALVSGPDVRRLAHSPMRTREEDLVRALQRTM